MENEIIKEYQANSSYVIRKVADEYLLVATDEKIYAENKLMMLNDTGRFIMENLKDYLTLDELINRARKEFSDENGLLVQEITEFVLSLTRMGLIKERSLKK